jgi:hypothetical protein
MSFASVPNISRHYFFARPRTLPEKRNKRDGTKGTEQKDGTKGRNKRTEQKDGTKENKRDWQNIHAEKEQKGQAKYI